MTDYQVSDLRELQRLHALAKDVEDRIADAYSRRFEVISEFGPDSVEAKFICKRVAEQVKALRAEARLVYGEIEAASV